MVTISLHFKYKEQQQKKALFKNHQKFGGAGRKRLQIFISMISGTENILICRSIAVELDVNNFINNKLIIWKGFWALQEDPAGIARNGAWYHHRTIQPGAGNFQQQYYRGRGMAAWLGLLIVVSAQAKPWEQMRIYLKTINPVPTQHLYRQPRYRQDQDLLLTIDTFEKDFYLIPLWVWWDGDLGILKQQQELLILHHRKGIHLGYNAALKCVRK